MLHDIWYDVATKTVVSSRSKDNQGKQPDFFSKSTFEIPKESEPRIIEKHTVTSEPDFIQTKDTSGKKKKTKPSLKKTKLSGKKKPSGKKKKTKPSRKKTKPSLKKT